jgi:hypothetical protein
MVFQVVYVFRVDVLKLGLVCGGFYVDGKLFYYIGKTFWS